MNKVTICLFFLLITPFCKGFNTSSSCMSCFNANSNYKFCLQNWASTSGYCCNKLSTTDYCANSRYFCSDQAPNDAMKLSFCPFIPAQCYGQAIATLDENSVKTGATTAAFGVDSVCSWKLRATSDYYFNKKIRVSVETANNVNCYIAYGDTISSATNYVSCSAGTQLDIDAD